MIRVLFCLFALVLPPASLAAVPVVLVVGDSLSAGYGLTREQAWPSLLQARLSDRGHPHRVVNASISGDTTRGGLARLPDALEIHDPELVIIELGANDGLRGIPVAEIRRNLSEMIQLAEQSGARVLLAGIRIQPNYGPRYTGDFHGVFHDLAEEYGTGLVPFILEGVALEDGMMQDDGLHPTAAGQPRILDNLWPEVDRLIEAQPSHAGDAADARTGRLEQ
jgi:acyl-CoA thioesterase-1